MYNRWLFHHTSKMLTFIKHWWVGRSCHFSTHSLAAVQICLIRNLLSQWDWLKFVFTSAIFCTYTSSDSRRSTFLSNNQKPQSHRLRFQLFIWYIKSHQFLCDSVSCFLLFSRFYATNFQQLNLFFWPGIKIVIDLNQIY